MADQTLDESARAIQLADSLNIEDVPAKLRCGMCNKLAVDAVKLLCCSTSICELCSHDIPETCVVCTHSPTSPDDCTPDKKLRTTVKAFIKTMERKRAKAAAPAVAPPVNAPTPVQAVSEPPASKAEERAQVVTAGNAETEYESAAEQHVPAETAADAPEDAAQAELANEITADPTEGEQEQEQEEEDDDDDDVVITTERPELDEEPPAEHQQHAPDYEGQNAEHEYGAQSDGQQMSHYGQNQQGFGNTGDYGNMNNYNPMMGMQGGMGMGNLGLMPNMMGMAGGMAGMNLDPSMMFNGGFGGMGDMSSMMNMGMGGGMGGMGGYGLMPGNMGMNMNMGGGPSGFFGPGNAGGYNHHQQFGNQVNNPFPHQRGYYNRGRAGYGRGRGGIYPRGGRGGLNSYNQYPDGQNQNYMNQQPNQGFHAGNDTQQQTKFRRGSPSYRPMQQQNSTAGNTTEHELNGEGDDSNAAARETTNVTDGQQADGVVGDEGAENADHDPVGEDGHDITMAGQATTTDAAAVRGDQVQQNDQHYQQGFGYAAGRGGFGSQGSGAYGNVTTIGGESEPPPAPPVNAPKGPKAMLQGLPNNGRYSRPQQRSVPPAAPSQQSSFAHQQNEKTARDDRSRSPSRHESRQHRERTQEREQESDEAHAERKDRERRKRKERESHDRRYKYEEDANGDDNGEKAKSRSESLDERDKRKQRDRYDDRHSSRRDRSREKRKHRDRSRSLEKTNSGHDESSDRSRRKSKNDRKRDDYDDRDRAKDRRSSRKHHSRREDEYEHDGKDGSKHSRSSRDDGKPRDRDREKRHVETEPVEDLGFSIKGAAQNKKGSFDKSMGPPSAQRSSRDDRRSSMRGDSTPGTPVSAEDKYAADREEAIAKRLAKHSSSLLGKRSSRAEDEPTSPSHADRASKSKRPRQDTRRHSARFE